VREKAWSGICVEVAARSIRDLWFAGSIVHRMTMRILLRLCCKVNVADRGGSG
jgi:hypothetical protein